ncbi:MAG: hypothetical protein WCX79_03350 [Candidatus Paceibacterota bacterium]
MEKIKQYFTENESGKKIVSICITILIGLCSFMFGRTSKSDIDKGISIEYLDTLESDCNDNTGQNKGKIEKDISRIGDNTTFNTDTDTKTTRKGEYFASIKGKKYYPVGCSAGKNIKSENRVYFSARIEAEKAGFELSASCK